MDIAIGIFRKNILWNIAHNNNMDKCKNVASDRYFIYVVPIVKTRISVIILWNNIQKLSVMPINRVTDIEKM